MLSLDIQPHPRPEPLPLYISIGLSMRYNHDPWRLSNIRGHLGPVSVSYSAARYHVRVTHRGAMQHPPPPNGQWPMQHYIYPHPSYGYPPPPPPPPQPMSWQPYPPTGPTPPPPEGGGWYYDEDGSRARGRWVLEPEDALLLESVFSREPNPGRELRLALAMRLRVRPRQILVWFQNKRQRIKKGAKPTVAEKRAAACTDSTSTQAAQLLLSTANGSRGSDEADEGEDDEIGEEDAVPAGVEPVDLSIYEPRVSAAATGSAVDVAVSAAAHAAHAQTKGELMQLLLNPSGGGAGRGPGGATEVRSLSEVRNIAATSVKPSPSVAAAAAVFSAAEEAVAVAQSDAARKSSAPAPPPKAPGMLATHPRAALERPPDGYTNGSMIWIRPEILVPSLEMLGTNRTPIYLTPQFTSSPESKGQAPAPAPDLAGPPSGAAVGRWMPGEPAGVHPPLPPGAMAAMMPGMPHMVMPPSGPPPQMPPNLWQPPEGYHVAAVP